MSRRLPALLIICLVSAGCSPKLMPTPVVFPAAGIDPFAHLDAETETNGIRVFFATDREPVDPDDATAGFTDQRSPQLLLGEARITIGPRLDWEELRAVSLDPRRTKQHGATFEIESIATFGPMWSTVVAEDGRDELQRSAFPAAINEQLAHSRSPDVYVFVHGYKSDFERPLFVTAELSHYLGRDAVFIAYNWSARNAWLGYVHDRDSALYSVGHFWRFLQELAVHTDARRIHIVGHSTGASLVARALRELRLLNAELDGDQLIEKNRIGQVVYAAPDVDVSIFKSHFVEGFQDLAERTTVYVNPGDNALRMASDLMYGLTRLGDPSPTEFSRAEMESLSLSPRVEIVDADNAKGSDFTGHRYYRESPWVSSDLLLLLRTGWGAGERGLMLADGDYAWTFPDDYVEVLATVGARAFEREMVEARPAAP